MAGIKSTHGKILPFAVMSIVLLSNIANSKPIVDHERFCQDAISSEVISIMSRSHSLERDVVDSLWNIVPRNSAIMGRENVIRYIQNALHTYVERGKRIRDEFTGEIATRPVIISPSPVIIGHSSTAISKNNTVDGEWFRQVMNGIIVKKPKQ